jgi:L-alanine-DL-glutamate epimerase-like enolase superfamily enzyme
MAEIENLRRNHHTRLDRQTIQQLLPAGAARNAFDCALWDLEAKKSNRRVWEIANHPVIRLAQTSFTLSVDTPAAMRAKASQTPAPMLKLKLDGSAADLARVQAVRQAAPASRLIVDPNESWSPDHYLETVPELAKLGVELIEQPFPAATDAVLQDLPHPIPVCADESCHTTADLPSLTSRYEVVNIKLDKTGGLTEALLLLKAARQAGFRIFIGCMVCTSLGAAPARVLAGPDDIVDLDGPLLLAGDRHHALVYDEFNIALPSPQLWG